VHERKGKVFAVSSSGAASTQDVQKRWNTGLDGILSDPHCVLAKRFGVTLEQDPDHPTGLRTEPAVLYLRQKEGATETVYVWRGAGPLHRPRLDDVWKRIVRPRLEGETVADDLPVAEMGFASLSIGNVSGALLRKFRHKQLDGDAVSADPEPEAAASAGAAKADDADEE
jgi:hypothetical protein